MQVDLLTGPSAYVAGSLPYEAGHFAYNYTGFRAFDRFLTQLDGSKIGMITWPGGALAEFQTDRFGLEYDGLWNGFDAAGDLPEIFEAASNLGAGVSVVLPTIRYMDRPDALASDVRAFMADLLGGQYGPVPERLVLEIGSEFYSTFADVENGTAEYAIIADQMLREIAAAVADPSVNLLGIDPEIAMQGGRTLDEDEVIRDHLGDDALRSIDMVIHHRFAVMATGVDPSATEIGRILDAWEEDMAAVGEDRPELFLGTYNVASYSRGEALRDYVAEMGAQGIVIDREAVDLAGRTDTAFETYFQSRLERYDYGPEHPRVMLEMMAEYGAEGMGGAGTYGSDMIHAARLTYTDAEGNPVKFVGQDMLDMMAESITGTRLLGVSTTNDRFDDVWTYAFEDDHTLVVFLSADDLPPGEVTVSLRGAGTLQSVRADSLTAEVPADWMERFGIPDNPDVDETPESRSFALGVREGATITQTDAGVSVVMDKPHQIIRLAFAKDEVGATDIAAWSDGEEVALSPDAFAFDDLILGDDPDAPETVDLDAEDEIDPVEDSSGGGFGGLGLILLLPLLMMGAG